MNKKSLVTRLAAGIIVPVVLLVTLLLCYNAYSIQYYNRQLMEATRTSMSLYVKTITDVQSTADSFMNDIIAGNSNYWYLQRPLNSVEGFARQYDLLQLIKYYMGSNKLMSVAMIYSEINDSWLYYMKEGSKNGAELKQCFIEMITAEPESAMTRSWNSYIASNDSAYMYKIYGWRGAYILLGINIADIPKPTDDERLLEEKRNVVSKDHGHTILFDGGTPLNDRAFVKEAGIGYADIYDNNIRAGTNRRYSVIGESIGNSDITMCVVRPYKGALDSLSPVQSFLLFLSVFSVMIIPFYIARIRRYVTQPLRRLMKKIEAVKSENLEVTGHEDYGSLELNEVSMAFEEMLGRVKALRIEKYEIDLERQKSTMEYLKLQLKPHFFINCLKSIFAMVQNHNYENIQDMVILVSENLRYMFRDSLSLVTLEQELNYVKNYLKIQELGMARTAECQIQVDAQALTVKLPPLTIQTFVENSMKYASDNDRLLEIRIQISILDMDTEKYLDISISDNGVGYPEHIIWTFHGKIEKVESGEHVGIHNVLWRLIHVFGDHMEYVINNIDGAFTELIIPLKGVDTGECHNY